MGETLAVAMAVALDDTRAEALAENDVDAVFVMVIDGVSELDTLCDGDGVRDGDCEVDAVPDGDTVPEPVPLRLADVDADGDSVGVIEAVAAAHRQGRCDRSPQGPRHDPGS